MSTNLSRRKLGFGALGATLIGTGAAAQDTPRERRRQLPWTFAPVPVVTSAPYHVFLPTAATPDLEPCSISNFKGFSGIAIVDGNVTRTNVKSGEQQLFPFLDTDMRFMTGMFVGTDGQEHPGTFALL
jgi:hypothetical protein